MNLTYAIRDEKNKGGQQLTIHRGEIKTISVFWFDETGAPYYFTTITELQVAISKGTSAALKKLLSLTEVTLIRQGSSGGYFGCSFSLSAADTNGLPISSTISASLTITNSTTSQDEIDMPEAFNVQAPLVS